LRAIASVTLVIAPILLLLLIQFQFLPYHNSLLTWTQRISLLADIFLICWLWGGIIAGRDADAKNFSCWPAGIGLTLGCIALAISWLVATFPGEWQDDLPNQGAFWFPFPKPHKELVTLNRLIFQSDVDETTRRRLLPFSNTLVLSGFNIYEGLGIDEPDKAKWRNFVFRARGRDLRGARFDLANLTTLDFTGAHLENASLQIAQLSRVSFEETHLENTALDAAQLQGASLVRAELQDASLVGAQLQGASLNGAQLQGTNLLGGQFQGAMLNHAKLQGAALDSANLKGASLIGAQLQGASLKGAQLQGASLTEAQLQGASLIWANLEATDLSDAYLWRTNRISPPSRVSAIRMSGSEIWLPEWIDEGGKHQSWNGKAYQDLRATIEAVPAGPLRDAALMRIQSLDCANPDPTLASCDPTARAPPAATAWRKSVDGARVDDAAYAKALAQVLRTLACAGGDDAIYVMRGLTDVKMYSSALIEVNNVYSPRLLAAGPAVQSLIELLENKDSTECAVVASLTDSDRARLLSIEREAIEAAIAKATRRSGFQ
jgi:uncharacterized protein YjbI with pentapeptide repeats